MKITIQDYSKREGVSVQSVYARIKRGSLISEKIDGIKYVIESDSTQDSIQDSTISTQESTIELKILKIKFKNNKHRLKEARASIRELKKTVEKLENRLDTKEDYIANIMNSIIPLIRQSSSIKLSKDTTIDAEYIEKKKGKKGKKGKRK